MDHSYPQLPSSIKLTTYKFNNLFKKATVNIGGDFNFVSLRVTYNSELSQHEEMGCNLTSACFCQLSG